MPCGGGVQPRVGPGGVQLGEDPVEALRALSRRRSSSRSQNTRSPIGGGIRSEASKRNVSFASAACRASACRRKKGSYAAQCRSRGSATGTRVPPLPTRHRGRGRGGTGSARAPRAGRRTRRPSHRRRSVLRAWPVHRRERERVGRSVLVPPGARPAAANVGNRCSQQPGGVVEQRELGVEPKVVPRPPSGRRAPSLPEKTISPNRSNACRIGGLSNGSSWNVQSSYVSAPASASTRFSIQSVAGHPLASPDSKPMHHGVSPAAFKPTTRSISSLQRPGDRVAGGTKLGSGYQTNPFTFSCCERRRRADRVGGPRSVRRRWCRARPGTDSDPP